MFRLSDPPPKATRNSEGLTEYEADTLEKLMMDIERNMAENPESASDFLTQPGEVDSVPVSEDKAPVEGEEPAHGNEAPSAPKEDLSQTSASKEKDEL